MKRIYTKSGDKGTTAIHGGQRVPKTDIRIEANGCIDELNVAIGIVRSMMPVNHPWQNYLKETQMNLMVIMSLVATPHLLRESNPNKLAPTIITDVEAFIDQLTTESSPSEYFILPGGNQVAAFLQQCRVLTRKAERRLWQLHDTDPVPELILQYMNRLSDLFFVMARYEMQSSHVEEERWRAFAYKRRTNQIYNETKQTE